jgi:hypothetical protein
MVVLVLTISANCQANFKNQYFRGEILTTFPVGET